MDRVTRKKTIGNSPQCRTWSKKHDESDLFSNIPLELKIEILLKLPAKSIAKLTFVSKNWSSIIQDKDFTNLYLTPSFTRPRLLITVHRRYMHLFYSGFLEDPSSDHQRVTISTYPDGIWSRFSPPVRGLICCLNGPKVLVANPSTGQFVTLPRLKTKRFILYSFFGYDPVNDLYKVLCMTRGRYVPWGGKYGSYWTEDHQVFTLGAKQKWRRIECKHRHCLQAVPEDKGTCIDGVVYYFARINGEVSQSLISFSLRCEEFNVIKLPEDIKRRRSYNRVHYSYSGKIALTGYSCNGTLDLWVLKDASKQEWSKASFLLAPCWKNLVEHQKFMFRGTLSTGELIFVPYGSSRYTFSIICYDLKENNARKVVTEVTGDINVYLDHVETPMLLPNMCQSDHD